MEIIFTICTDHHPMKYLDIQNNLSIKQERYVEISQKCNYEIRHIKGRSNKVSDEHSRK